MKRAVASVLASVAVASSNPVAGYVEMLGNYGLFKYSIPVDLINWPQYTSELSDPCTHGVYARDWKSPELLEAACNTVGSKCVGYTWDTQNEKGCLYSGVKRSSPGGRYVVHGGDRVRTYVKPYSLFNERRYHVEMADPSSDKARYCVQSTATFTSSTVDPTCTATAYASSRLYKCLGSGSGSDCDYISLVKNHNGVFYCNGVNKDSTVWDCRTRNVAAGFVSNNLAKYSAVAIDLEQELDDLSFPSCQSTDACAHPGFQLMPTKQDWQGCGEKLRALSTTPAASAKKCGVQCAQEKTCDWFSYNAQTLQCEMRTGDPSTLCTFNGVPHVCVNRASVYNKGRGMINDPGLYDSALGECACPDGNTYNSGLECKNTSTPRCNGGIFFDRQLKCSKMVPQGITNVICNQDVGADNVTDCTSRCEACEFCAGFYAQLDPHSGRYSCKMFTESAQKSLAINLNANEALWLQEKSGVYYYKSDDDAFSCANVTCGKSGSCVMGKCICKVNQFTKRVSGEFCEKLESTTEFLERNLGIPYLTEIFSAWFAVAFGTGMIYGAYFRCYPRPKFTSCVEPVLGTGATGGTLGAIPSK